jgi:hypothetical protein
MWVAICRAGIDWAPDSGPNRDEYYYGFGNDKGNVDKLGCVLESGQMKMRSSTNDNPN